MKYEKYRDSGFRWIEEIPFDWKMIRAKFLFSERVEKGHPEKPLLAATQTKGVVKKEDYGTRTVTAQKDFHLLKLVKVGDFVISLRSFQGGIEISYEEGIISPAYTIMNPSQKVDKYFIKHLFKSKFFILSLNRFVTGIREGQNIDYRKFKNSFLPVPPLVVQKSIANFLDQKITQIDHYIQLKKKTIALLQEQLSKLAINGMQKRNDTISEWQDNFPENWKMIKGKWLFEEIKIKNKPKEQLLAATQDRGVLPKSMCEQNFVSPALESLGGLKFVPKKSYVISLRSFQGGIEFSTYQGIVSPAYNIFKLVPEFDNEKHRNFYKYFFKTKPFIELLNTIITGIRDGQNINYSDFSNLVIPIPNKETLNRMFLINKKLQSVKKAFKKEITLIKEYRESLISAAVTGKIDVRSY